MGLAEGWGNAAYRSRALQNVLTELNASVMVIGRESIEIFLSRYAMKETIMKTAIVYVSTHHGNTKKLVDAISEKYDITVIDGIRDEDFDLNEFDRIGFASGIAFGKFYPHMLKLMDEKLPEGKDVFFLYTYGMKTDRYCNAARKIAEMKKAKILGEYGCQGYDTFGPLKLLGGISKGHPDKTDLRNAIEFYGNLK
jgi:flavodoxin